MTISSQPPPIGNKPYSCFYCPETFPSLTTVTRHEDTCKITHNGELLSARMSKDPNWWKHSYTTPLPTGQKDAWWKKPISAADSNGKKSQKKKKHGSHQQFSPSTHATYSGAQHSHHQWVNIGKYKVLAMSLSKANGVENEVDYQVVMAQSYLYSGSVLMNYESKFQRHQKERMIYVVWPDMGTIPLKDYEALLDYLERLLRGGKKIAVGCLGGHGRTGTILAGLIRRIEKLNGDDAIKTLRSRYCANAVETSGQSQMVNGKEPIMISSPPAMVTSAVGGGGYSQQSSFESYGAYDYSA